MLLSRKGSIINEILHLEPMTYWDTCVLALSWFLSLLSVVTLLIGIHKCYALSFCHMLVFCIDACVTQDSKLDMPLKLYENLTLNLVSNLSHDYPNFQINGLNFQ